VPATVSDPVFTLARQPQAQLAAGQVLARKRLATAAIDVSDGLFASVKILAEVNAVGAVMESDVELSEPLMMICKKAGVSPFVLAQNWGDWCLLVAVKPKSVRAAQAALESNGCNVIRIGTLTPTPGELLVRDRHGEPKPWKGVDQERFTPRSWHGDGIDGHIAWMIEQSGE
jgi:thiamine-monophosphate kinase